MGAGAGSLVALVVTYNRLDKLRDCLAALMSAPSPLLEAVLVVDNASTDGTDAWLSTHPDPRVHVLRLPANAGGAGGFAAGFAHAKEAFDPDWLVVMDDDAAPTADTFAHFHARDRKTAEGWAAAVYTPQGDLAEMNRPLRNPFWSFPLFVATLVKGRDAFHLGPDDMDAARDRQIDVVSFVGLFLSRAGLERGGLPDAGLFLYGDDTIYTLELSARGGVLRFDPDLVFIHDCDSRPEAEAVMRPFWRAYFYHRNLLIVYRRAAGPILFPLLRWVKMRAWRKRAPAYGKDAKTFLNLLDQAAADAAAQRKTVTRADVTALFPGGDAEEG